MVLQEFLQCFNSENMLIRHKEDCLSINGVQSVKVEKGTTEFENYFKQLPVPLKFMLISSAIQKVLKFMKVLKQKNIMIMFLVVLLAKLFVLMIDLVS